MIGRALFIAAAVAAPAHAQDTPPRLAAPTDCPTNPNCIPGLQRSYDVDATPHLVKLPDPDAGIKALEDGVGDVAVVFSSNPALSRPDILTLRDDKHMVGPDRVLPVVRSTLLDRYGPALKRRLDRTSRLLSTLKLRSLNQQVIDGRTPATVGAEFIDANGLGNTAKRRPGPRIVVGFQEFAENETLAHLYAESLRADGFRVTVRSGGGLRKETLASLKAGRIGMYPAYSGSLLEFLGGKTLRGSLAKLRAEPLRLSRAQNRNSFAMKRDRAAALGIRTLSDLARVWNAGLRRLDRLSRQ